tara:strand:- start:1831 stop:4512 length:2682 start_codon:yes stop_codon:yes gene_type:complete
MTSSVNDNTIPKAYIPADYETDVYKMWMDNDFFKPDSLRGKDPFVIIMPPPNVTGALHMGHALTAALEDLMIRWNRMLGHPSLLLPGADHAGIATQVVVERELKKQGESRQSLGREKFTDEIWKWVKTYGNRIDEQHKRLGISADWDRRKFTLEDGPSKAVFKTFFNLYNEGLIYKGERIINWCTSCRTALSDLEVKHAEEQGSLYHIRYLLEDKSEELIIATTRPETLFGDAAVAVNPADNRYSKMAGKNVILPITGRILPVIEDDSVDLDFGTGALKVTPGHDANDFEIGQRHGLEVINIINPNGTLNENGAPFQSLTIKQAREKVVNQLDLDGLLVNIEPHMHSVGKCDRSGDTIEPIVSSQWFVKTEQLAKPAIEAVKTGAIEIIPKRFEKVYFNWMENIKDWCISRQLWWGHQIPVWYCENCDEIIVNTDEPNSCPKCSGSNLKRDPDVLDTWFSSGLWTHSTLGWPENTEDLNNYYPGAVMETGYDILFFWVARMIMMGIYNNKGQVPFKTVYLHGLILDPSGSKMSKTKGNVLDPLDIVDQYGADAMRFALTTGNSPGQNIRLNEQKLEAGRNFANKIWNSSRFVMMKMDESNTINNWLDTPDVRHPQDQWILSRLNVTTGKVNSYMKNYQFGEAQLITHDFIWNEYCDWYIEMAKTRLKNKDLDCIHVLPYVLEKTMRLLHPFMPFLTETIWQNLTKKLPESIYGDFSKNIPALIIAAYPKADKSLFNEKAENDVNGIIEIIKAIRNIRSEFRIKPSEKINARVQTNLGAEMLAQQSETIKSLAFLNSLIIEDARDVESDEASLVLEQSTVVISLEGLVDIENEKKRLLDELEKHNRNEANTRGKLNNKQFTSKAPEEVIQREEDKLNKILERKERLNEIIRQLS